MPRVSAGGDAAAAAALLAAAATLLAPALFAGRAVYFRDVTIADVPSLAHVFGTVAAGELPIWNPLSAGGIPQPGAMQPLFYPLSLPFLPAAAGWIGWAAALAAYLLLHYWLAGLFTYALGRRWRWPRPAALAAGLAFMLGGYMVSLHDFLTLLPAAACLPLLLLAWERSWLAAVAAVALQVSCCRPDTTLLSLLLLAAHAERLGWVTNGGARGALAALARLAAVAAAGALLNAVTLVPALEFVSHSNRAQGIGAAEMALHSFPPLRAVALLLPGFFGHVETGTDWGRFFLSDPATDTAAYFLTLYGGVTVYLLALLARSPARQPGLVPFLWAAWSAALLLALGRHLPFFGWFAWLPGAGYIRFPSKFFLLWSFCLALLAGLGVARLAGGRRPPAWRPVAAALGVAAALALLLRARPGPLTAWAGTIDYGRWTLASWGVDVPATMRYLAPSIVDAGLREAALAAGLALAAWLAASWGRRGVALMPALLAADLLLGNSGQVYYTDPEVFATTPPLARLLQAEPQPRPRLIRPYGDGRFFRDEAAYARQLRGLTRTLSEERYRLAQDGLAYNTSLLYGLPSASLYGSLKPAMSLQFLLQGLYPPASDRLGLAAGDPRLDRYTRVAGALNIGYFVLPVQDAAGREPAPWQGNPNAALVWRDPRGLFVYKNRHLLPRARWVPDAAISATPAEAARAMDRHADRLGALTMVVDNDALKATVALRAGLRGEAPGTPRECRVVSYGTTRVEIASAAPTSGFVVLADNHYPGWGVEVDGQARPLLLADGYARGVYVEAGRHLVTFRYRPASLGLGLLLSLLTAAALVAAARRPVR